MNNKYDLFINLLEKEKAKHETALSLQLKIKETLAACKTIYVWPAGQMGRALHGRLEQSGFSNIQLVDSNPESKGAVTPNNITDCQNSVVVVATLNHNSVYNAAKNMEFAKILMYYDVVRVLPPELQEFPEVFYIQTFWGLKQHLFDNKTKYMDMYNTLEDNLSRERFLENMLFRLTGDITYTFPWDEDVPQYFNSLVPDFDENSVIVDGGGFIGDSLEQFLPYSGGKFKSYSLFEPDEEQLNRAKKVSDDSRVHYIAKGLSDKVGEARFNPGGAGGMINADGEIAISLTSIDSEIDDKITFIKMDIEGAELAALKGAEKTIREHKPTLAICLYHKASDYTDIFEYIRSLNPDYKFYIRHHLDYYAEMVLYAV